MTEHIAEAVKEMGDWNESALLDRIVVWDRWIEKGIAPEGTKEARDAATQIIIQRADRLREALRNCVETWRPLLADADLTAHENPAYLTLMHADLVLGENRA